MLKMRRGGVLIGAVIVCVWGVLPCMAGDGFLTIREVQYSESPDGASPYDGQVIDCAGGIVVAKVERRRPRLFLQDPNALDSWGAIQVKGWAGDAFASVAVGDWVELEQIFVEENRGTTFLQYWDQNPDNSIPLIRVLSNGHSIPRSLLVDVNEIRSPEYLPMEDAWVVADHNAERFESMLVQIRNVAVVDQGMGKAQDNYELKSFYDPNDPNARCWASDYLNEDLLDPNLYLSGIEVGRRLRAVTGVLEQYTNLGNGFDYYQLLTLSEASVVGLCPADLDKDGDVDLWDFEFFTEQWLTPSTPLVGDLNVDGKVDPLDLDLFNIAWQQADTNGDGIVNGNDLD